MSYFDSSQLRLKAVRMIREYLDLEETVWADLHLTTGYLLALRDAEVLTVPETRVALYVLGGGGLPDSLKCLCWWTVKNLG